MFADLTTSAGTLGALALLLLGAYSLIAPTHTARAGRYRTFVPRPQSLSRSPAPATVIAALIPAADAAFGDADTWPAEGSTGTAVLAAAPGLPASPPADPALGVEAPATPATHDGPASAPAEGGHANAGIIDIFREVLPSGRGRGARATVQVEADRNVSASDLLVDAVWTARILRP